MNTPDLAELAGKQFDPLTTAERALLRAAAEGTVANCGNADSDTDPQDDPIRSDAWTDERNIRAKLIRWLCLDDEASKLVDPEGIRIDSARIIDELHLTFATISFPLRLRRCRVVEDLYLEWCEIPALTMDQTRTRSVFADSATIKGNALFGNQFHADGMLDLRGAHLGGDLSCAGGHFINPKGAAVHLECASITIRLFLSDGFHAEGAVILTGATINGGVTCHGGSFHNPADAALAPGPEPQSEPEGETGGYAGIALDARESTSGSSFFLMGGFEAMGMVDLRTAKIGGSLVCSGGRFRNPASQGRKSGTALVCDGATIENGVGLDRGFYAEGLVRGTGMKVGTDFVCDGQFLNEKGGVALQISASEFQGSVYLYRDFRAEGCVMMIGAHIRGDLICQATIIRPDGLALLLDNAHITSRVILNEGFHAEGAVSLANAQIGGNVYCGNATFHHGIAADGQNADATLSPPGQDLFAGIALSAASTEIGGHLFLTPGFQAEGMVVLNGARIGGDMNCAGATIRRPGGAALAFDNARVTSRVFLNQGFRAEGIVSLGGAQIGGNMQCDNATFLSGTTPDGQMAGAGVSGGGPDLFAGRALNAPGAEFGGDLILTPNFEAQGMVFLRTARIRGALVCTGARISRPAATVDSDFASRYSGTALMGDGLSVGDTIFLDMGFSAEGMTTLAGAHIGVHLNCSGSQFRNPGGVALWLAGLRTTGDLYLNSAFDGQVVLSRASVSGVLINLQGWQQGSPVLDGFTYSEFRSIPEEVDARLEWLALQSDDLFSTQPYQQMAKVLSEVGDDRSAQKLHYAMEKRARRVARGKLRMRADLLLAAKQPLPPGQASAGAQGSQSTGEAPFTGDEEASKLSRRAGFAAVWDFLYRAIVGYGYYAWRAVWGLVILAFFGMGLFWFGYRHGGVIPTEKDAAATFLSAHQPPPSYEHFHALAYSAENTFPLVKLGQTDRWAPNPNQRSLSSWGGVLRWFQWAQIVLGWIFATFFVAGVSGAVRRD
jgi:hypothetical protein